MYTQKVSAPCPLYFRGSKQVSTCCMYCIACIALTSMVNAQNFLEWCDECAEESESESRSVGDSLWPHGLHSPWNSPGQNTGVGSLSLLQGIFPTQGWNPDLPHCRRILYQLSHKGSPRILAWVAYSFSSRSSQPRNLSRSPALQADSLPTELSETQGCRNYMQTQPRNQLAVTATARGQEW